MKLAHCYKTLGLRRGASLREVKAAYRELVRTCPPDLNPNQQAIDRFIEINDAYTALSNELKRKAISQPKKHQTVKPSARPAERLNLRELKLTLERLGIGNFHMDEADEPYDIIEDALETESAFSQPEPVQEPEVGPVAEPTIAEPISDFSKTPVSDEREIGLKQDAYAQLRTLLRQQKFPRAIALIEGLAHRLPEDPEISQWQAIVYQRWGRYLIGQGQLHKAHVYLHKALQTDPNNPSLHEEVNLDLGQLELLVQAASVT